MRTLVLLLAVKLAGGPVALRTTGIVVTNGSPVPDGATVWSGDTITTGPGGQAVLSASELGRVEVRPESEARLGTAGVELHRGAVAASRLAVLAGGYIIRTQEGDGWYAVARRDGRLLVAAHQGNVLIAAAGAPPVLVPQGSYAEQEPEAPKDKDKRKRKRGARAAAGAGAAGAGGWTIGGLSHAASVALVVGLGAGVAAATAGVALLNDSGPSPED